MFENSQPYQSIACSLYDTLEALATRKSDCVIIYKTENREQSVTSRIVDLFSHNGAEYLKLENGITIRLDTLITVNGISMNERC